VAEWVLSLAAGDDRDARGVRPNAPRSRLDAMACGWRARVLVAAFGGVPAAFTLVETLVVMVLAVLLVGGATLYYRDVRIEAQSSQATQDLARLRDAVNGWLLVPGRTVPAELSAISSLATSIVVDPWGMPYVLQPAAGRIVCAGPNRVVDTAPADGSARGDDRMIVLAPPGQERALREMAAFQEAAVRHLARPSGPLPSTVGELLRSGTVPLDPWGTPYVLEPGTCRFISAGPNRVLETPAGADCGVGGDDLSVAAVRTSVERALHDILSLRDEVAALLLVGRPVIGLPSRTLRCPPSGVVFGGGASRETAGARLAAEQLERLAAAARDRGTPCLPGDVAGLQEGAVEPLPAADPWGRPYVVHPAARRIMSTGANARRDTASGHASLDGDDLAIDVEDCSLPRADPWGTPYVLQTCPPLPHRVVCAGPDRRFDTGECAAGMAGDDLGIAVVVPQSGPAR
jgi:type II secretory pathway pseudopilin PulG